MIRAPWALGSLQVVLITIHEGSGFMVRQDIEFFLEFRV